MFAKGSEDPKEKLKKAIAAGEPVKAIATKPIVKRTAQLARLELTDEEIDKFASQLTSILNYIEKIRELDLRNVEPLANVGELQNVWREDEVKTTDVHSAMMDIAPEAKKGHFRVPRIIEE